MNERNESKLPVELITTNLAHQYVAQIDVAERIAKSLHNDEERTAGLKDVRCAAIEGFARTLLCKVAHNANEAVVRKALHALGCPAEEDEIWQHLEAAREAQRAEAAPEQHPRAN